MLRAALILCRAAHRSGMPSIEQASLIFSAPGVRQFSSRVAQPVGQNPNDFNRHFRESGEQSQEMILADAQRLERRCRPYGGCARNIAQNGDLADDRIRLEFGDLDLSAFRESTRISAVPDRIT